MKLTSSSNFFKPGEDLKTGDIVKFTDEGELTHSEKFDRDQFTISLQKEDGTEKKLTINNTSRKNLIEEYGSDTVDWIGKEARVWVVQQMVDNDLKDVLYLTHPNKDLKGKVMARG